MKPDETEAPRSKLERALPGARVEQVADAVVAEQFRVVWRKRVLSTGASEREAVDRALFLWSSR